MMEQPAQAIDDGEAETQAAMAISKTIEFTEDIPPLILRDAGSRVPHFDVHGLAAPPASDHHAARSSVPHGI
jgi:hypothetical protein